ncbi:hypothetical protein [Actinophytocola sp. NPDC049390]|uniref:hypothetical protein n=1 Tax=Actinophytocola sp. NPDC049390 TaxID=3363894 RepID=UPI0037A45B37
MADDDTPDDTPDEADVESDAPAPESADAEATHTGESTSDTPSGVGATTPAWWSWVGRHRKPVGIVAALVVLAVVATVVTVSVVTPGPTDVVQSYMDALQAGDTETALDIVGEPEDDDHVRILAEEALADDWTVTSVVERHRRGEEADVDVTITSGDTSEQGRFHLVEDDDGWTIESPFVRVDLVVSGLDTIELGGVREPVRGEGAAMSLLLFPGAYDLYPSLGEHVTFDPGVLVAAPQTPAGQTTRFAVRYTLTDKGTAVADEAITDRVEACESMPGLTPDGCPFNVGDDRAFYEFSDVVGVKRSVTSMPKARFVPAPDGTPRLVLRTPGTVTITGSGIPYEPEGAEPEPFTVTCEFGIDSLAVPVTFDGVTMTSAATRPYGVGATPVCF